MSRAGVSRPLATLAAWALCLSLGCGHDSAPTAAGVAEAAHQGVWFVPVTAEAGLQTIQTGGDPPVDFIIDSIGQGGAWLDYDNDGDPDLYLAQGATRSSPTSGPPDRLFRNDGDQDGDGIPSFRDVTGEAGLGDTLWSFGVAVADYDNDGDPDIYLTNWGANRLYRNNGDGTFTDVAPGAGVAEPGWGVSAAWSDVDRDGDLDLYVANYVEFSFERYPARGEPGRRGEPPCRWREIEVCCGPRNLEAGADVFFRNEGDPDGDGIPAFTDATLAAGLTTGENYYSLGLLFLDGDDDGDDDLYVANDSVRNSYFINRGDGTFDEASILVGLAYNEQGYEQASMGVAAADYDGDGRVDLAVTNFSHDHDTIYHNQGEQGFLDVSYATDIGSATYYALAWGVIFDDLDHDRRPDLFIANGHVYPQVDLRETGTTFRQRNHVFLNRDGASFEEITDRAGPGLEPVKCSRAVLPVDLEGDGDLDVLVTNLNDTPDLLRDDGRHGHWIQVDLRGSASNRDGIGAQVAVTEGGRRQIRQVTRSASYAGSILPVAHFGLGDATVVDLEVRWPSGRRSKQSGVRADQRLTIVEPAEN